MGQNLKQLAKQGKTVPENTSDEIQEMLNTPELVKRSDYLKVLENWQSVFPVNQFFITYYENIEREPEKLILDVYRFLGVIASEEYISPHIRQEVNCAGKPKSPIPSEFERHLAKRHLEQLKELANRFDGPPSDWPQRAKAILEQA
ncbi:MAG: sulfotransferase domain-containing protein [Anaerolineales bacterium]|nr:sulfotransferase domain-containing protein [Anaerolineales bacterium]